MQPGALLAGGEVEVGLRPLPRPVVLVAVEAGRVHPVRVRELGGVLDAEAALLGAVDEEQSSEGPVRLPPEVGLALLVDEEDLATGVGELRRRDESGQPVAHDNGVCVHGVTLILITHE